MKALKTGWNGWMVLLNNIIKSMKINSILKNLILILITIITEINFIVWSLMMMNIKILKEPT